MPIAIRACPACSCPCSPPPLLCPRPRAASCRALLLIALHYPAPRPLRAIALQPCNSRMEWRVIASAIPSQFHHQLMRFLEVLENVGCAIGELILMAMVVRSRKSLSVTSVNVTKPCVVSCPWS